MKKTDMERYVVSSLDLPAELSPGIPRIIITGNDSVLVENHSGIREFCSQRIRISCGYGEIVIEGKDLCLRLLKKDELEAEGEVCGVSFLREENL